MRPAAASASATTAASTLAASFASVWRRPLPFHLAQAPLSLEAFRALGDGVASEADHKSWTREQLKPYIAHAIESFGFDRIMFGGDWPVCTLAATLCQWVEALRAVVQERPAEAQRKLFHDNAARFYQLA